MQSDKSSHDRKVRRKQSTPTSTSANSMLSSSSKKDAKDDLRSSSKTSSNSVTGNSSVAKSNDISQNAMSITLAAIEQEEKEALARDPTKDVEVFNQTCDLIRRKLSKLKIQKKEGSSELDPKFSDLKLEVAMSFLELKRLNRFDKIRCKTARDQVTEAKQKVDSYHLQLQNLMYEVLHLQKEINKCHEFRSRDESIELIELDQFFKEGPEEMTKSLENEQDSHKCTLARLEWELEQRKILASTLKDKIKLKENIVEDINKEKRRLESIKPILLNIVEAAQPLQHQLGLPLQSSDNQHSNAEFLSRPLYTMYINAYAMKEAYNEEFSVSVNGNVDEAKATQFTNILEEEESAESDLEDRKGKRHRRSKLDKRELIMKKLLTAHPLSVCLTFNNQESKIKLLVEFFHMVNLNIVTVKASLTGPGDINRSELLNEHILDNLFERDDGLTSPNPANDYHLKTLKLDKFHELSHKIGYAYKWAQTLAGLHFLPRDLEKDDAVTNFTEVIKLIKSRFKSRVALHQIIMELERGSTSLPPSLVPVSFNKLSCLLKEWRSCDLDEWMKCETGRNMYNFNLIDGSEFFYKVTLERGSAHLKAYVAIPSDYPVHSPIFQLILNWQSEKTSSIDTSLRDLEHYVNIKCFESIELSDRMRTLAIQVYMLCTGFDTLLEAEQNSSGAEGPLEFQKGRIFSRNYSGRDHSKPFIYAPEYGFFS